jgi:inner membrane protein
MITAHLPSGYVLGRLWPAAPLVLPAALIGGILPDFDMIWFYLIDDRAFHHHHYWVHVPAFWAMIAAIVLPLVTFFARRYLPAATAFFAALLEICPKVGDGCHQAAFSSCLIPSLNSTP